MRPVRHAASLAIVVVAVGLVLGSSATAHGQTSVGTGAKIPSGIAAAVLTKDKAQAILGKPVTSATGENMGRIVDVIVDKVGMPRAAIIDFGGFLGVGSRKVAVDWNALHFAPAGNAEKITLDLTRDQVKSAPEYQKGKPVVVLGATGNTQAMPDGEYPLDQ
jgi:PRC-barrel domain